ncbi:MAG: TonB family protein [Thermodesulfobacteriota bacterium]|nr:TonB family protein [Thermodesulfobacteriota bacterium]
MLAHGTALTQANDTDRVWLRMIVVSMLCHGLFLSGIVFLPELRHRPRHLPTAVEVDLVSLPEGELAPQGPSPQGPAPETVKEKPPLAETVQAAEREKAREPITSKKKPAKVAAPPPKETVSVAPKPLQVKRSLKKKSYDVSKVITKAIAKIEKRADVSRPRPVLQAIDKLQKQVKKGAAGVQAGGTAAKTGMSKKTLDLLDIYHAEIWDRIRKNWAYSEELDTRPSNPEAVIIMKIMKNGEIRDIWFEKRSGSRYFDASAMKAVKKSDPLPPLPDGFLHPYYEIGFRFNPSEMKRRP